MRSMPNKRILVKTCIACSGFILAVGFFLYVNRDAICARLAAELKKDSAAGDFVSPPDDGVFFEVKFGTK